jgi:hypothetical protein
MTIPKTMASNGCRYEKAARREASMRTSASNDAVLLTTGPYSSQP